MKTIDFERRSYVGEYKDETFEVTMEGTLSSFKVPDTVRDEMRMEAAAAFLGSAKALGLSRDEHRYWSAVAMLDRSHEEMYGWSTRMKVRSPG